MAKPKFPMPESRGYFHAHLIYADGSWSRSRDFYNEAGARAALEREFLRDSKLGGRILDLTGGSPREVFRRNPGESVRKEVGGFEARLMGQPKAIRRDVTRVLPKGNEEPVSGDEVKATGGIGAVRFLDRLREETKAAQGRLRVP